MRFLCGSFILLLFFSLPQGSSPTLSAFPGLADCDDIAVGPTGDLYLACHSPQVASGYPVKPSATAGGLMDAFILRLDSTTGHPIYVTRIGGTDYDEVGRIDVDQSGFAYAVGFTKSTDYSTSPDAVQRNFGGGESDALLVKIAPNGDVVYSTLLGGDAADQGNGLEVDAAGNVYVAGTTWSRNFPGQAGTRVAKNGDVFVSMIHLQLPGVARSLVFGGSGDEKLTGIALSARAEPWLVGYTESKDFPTRRGIQSKLGGKSDLFLTNVSLLRRELLVSTYFGGSAEDSGWGVTIDRNGNPIVAGTTDSADLSITPEAFQWNNNGKTDAFVTVFEASSRRVLHSTYIGGSAADAIGYDGRNITTDAQGNIWIVGVTSSTDFPTRRPHQSAYAGGDDGFAMALSPDLERLCYGTFHGGRARDVLEGIVYAGSRGVFVAGLTFSADLMPSGLSPVLLGTLGPVNAIVLGLPAMANCS